MHEGRQFPLRANRSLSEGKQALGLALPAGPDDLSQAESGCRTESEAKRVKGKRRREVWGRGLGQIDSMETWQEYSREQIKESKWRKRENDTENAKNRDGGTRVWFGDGEKKNKAPILFNIVQGQEGKNQEVEHDQKGTVVVG